MTQATAVLDLIERLRAAGQDFCIATIVRTANLTSAKAGAKAVVTPDGTMTGFVGGGCVTGAVRKAALEAIRTARPEMIRIRPKEDVQGDVDTDGAPLFTSSCPSGGTVEVFLEPMRAARRIVVCGASPVAQSLLAIARATGFQVIHAADKAEDRFAQADDFVADFDLTGLALGDSDGVVVATQGQADRKALAAALNSGASYVSMIGSHRKIDALKAALVDNGTVDPARVARLKGPAGFDIGAVGPEEIALSIVAEVVALLRRPDSEAATTVGRPRG